MTQLAPDIRAKGLEGQYLFLDNDFLNGIFSDDELFAESLSVLTGHRIIDGFTRFEFLRNVFPPDVLRKKEEFLNSDLFWPAAEHQTVFVQVRQNALTLSHLYAHNKVTGASTVDLFLAGTLMLYQHALLVTGNKKDFPSCLFDLKGVLSFEKGDGSIKPISIIKFNPEKFANCEAAYRNVRPAN